jgi:hypothetical protein
MFLEPPRFLLTKVFNLLGWGYSKGQMLSSELVESSGYRAHEFTFVTTKPYKMIHKNSSLKVYPHLKNTCRVQIGRH